MNSLRETLLHPFVQVWRAWDAFWFTPQTARSLGVLRIVAGCMSLYTHLVWGSVLRGYLGPAGWQDELLVRQAQRESYAWSFWWYVPLEWYESVHWVCIAIIVAFTLGIAVRITSWLAFIISVSYAYRAPMANFGLDQINGLLALYLAIGPSGAAYSCDRWWMNFRRAIGPLRRGEQPEFAPLAPLVSAGFAARLIQVHMAMLYLWAGLAKLKGDAWWDGSAVWMALANAEYRSADLTFMAWYPSITELLAHVTIAWECSFWVFAFRPGTRWLALAIGIGVHFGIGAFLGLWTFGLVMMIAYIGFIPPETIAKWEAMFMRFFAREGASVRVPYRSDSFLSLHSAAWRAAFRTENSLMFQEELRAVRAPAIPLTADVWWRALCEQSSNAWPFKPRRSKGERRRPSMLFVARGPRIQNTVQEYFLARGWDCRTAGEAATACAVLSIHACDCLVLLLESESQIEDFARLRSLCVAAGVYAPRTITAKGERVIHATLDWRPMPEHCLHEGPLKMRELRLQAESLCEVALERDEPKSTSDKLPRIRRA